MAMMPNKTKLFEWLGATIDALPSKGQIVLNIDASTIGWEVKATYPSDDEPNERTEIKRIGRLQLGK